MSNLLSARSIDKSFSTRFLFQDVTIHLATQERLGIIGPNGSGKSTLLKIFAGIESYDSGEVITKRGLRLCYIPQKDSFSPTDTPISILSHAIQGEGYETETAAKTALSKLGFERFDQPIGELSGGWRKRVSIALGLIHDAEIILLDEPTNHLDIKAMQWLETFIDSSSLSFVFITHDRRFLENCASRIIELAPSYPDGIFDVEGNYSEFVRRKEAFLISQEAEQSALANKVRRDTAWLRQGIQGRQTRNKTQVRDAASRRAEHKAVEFRNESPHKTAAIDFDGVGRKTNRLLTAFNLEKTLGGKLLFTNLEIELTPQKRIGLVGPNGSGKTTLLRVLEGELNPDTGTVKKAEDLKIVTSSQHRTSIDQTLTLEEALCPIGEMIDYRGKSIHVSGWADRFLFDKNQLQTQIRALSGGEQARVHIASLMLQPADILFLDEPTNDLDIPTLQVLEEALLEFPGAVMLVTHDRFMLERIASEFIELDGLGNVKHQVDFQKLVFNQPEHRVKSNVKKSKKVRVKSIPTKLSYKLQQEFSGMEQEIAKNEERINQIEIHLNEEQVIENHSEHAALCKELSESQLHVEQLYIRWTELEEMQH